MREIEQLVVEVELGLQFAINVSENDGVPILVQHDVGLFVCVRDDFLLLLKQRLLVVYYFRGQLRHNAGTWTCSSCSFLLPRLQLLHVS